MAIFGFERVLRARLYHPARPAPRGERVRLFARVERDPSRSFAQVARLPLCSERPWVGEPPADVQLHQVSLREESGTRVNLRRICPQMVLSLYLVWTRDLAWRH